MLNVLIIKNVQSADNRTKIHSEKLLIINAHVWKEQKKEI